MYKYLKQFIGVCIIVFFIAGLQMCNTDIEVIDTNIIEDITLDTRFYHTYKESEVHLNFVYCLRDIMNGNPSSGGCWEIVSLPEGSTITAEDLIGDNPCIEFNQEPCPSEFKFKYTIQCDCPDTYAILTICIVCDCEIIPTFTCSPNPQ